MAVTPFPISEFSPYRIKVVCQILNLIAPGQYRLGIRRIRIVVNLPDFHSGYREFESHMRYGIIE
jgi:hypothetical protein